MVTTPPVAPNRAIPLLFSQRMDDFLAWLVIAVPEFNTLALSTGSGSFTLGAEATPSITFVGDTDTGIWHPAANSVGVSAGGAEIARFLPGGFRLGNPAAAVPGATALLVIEAVGATGQTMKRNSADGAGPILYMAKSRGAAFADLTIVAANDTLADIRAHGADGTTHVFAAKISALVEGTPTAGNVQAGWRFSTGSGPGVVAEALKIDTNQAVLATGMGGLGYGLGSGGAVTQATSRATGVTRNTPNGQITMFSAAGAATWASFTLTNSAIAAGDTILLTQQGGTNVYNFTAKAQAGSAVISFQTTGGVAVDAPIINFAVIKAVNA
ncbi:hypothetical protein [Cypionkella sp. TWP1-2-1b2]|uniref:hypothetical protein n=1 Tax=Cypionkella sp. TWP1-2-1b2 TaxID=2804675 RepID=UPI003CE6A4C2